MSGRKEFVTTTEDLPLCEILATIYLYQVPGVLTVKTDAHMFTIMFQDGCIAFAQSSRPEDQFRALLLELGKMSRETCDALMGDPGLTAQEQSSIAIKESVIRPDELVFFVRYQVLRILYEVLRVIKADITFKPGLPDGEDLIRLNLITSRVIYEAVRYVFDFNVIVPVIPSDETLLTLVPSRQTILNDLSLLPGEQGIISLIDGHRTMGDIRRTSPLGPQGTDRFIAFLALLRIVAA